MHGKVSDHFRNISQYTAKALTLFAKIGERKKRDKEQKGVLIFPDAYINNIYSNGNAE